MMKSKTILIIDSSESNADLYYKTGFFMPDSCIYIENGGNRMLFLSDLELDRGKKEADVDEVFSISEYMKKIPSRKRKTAGFSDITNLIFKEYRIRKAVVPGRFPVRYADELRKFGYTITCKRKEPFFDERLKKTEQEIKLVKDSLKKTAMAMEIAVKKIMSSEIKNGGLYINGDNLTSEYIKGIINSELSKFGFSAAHTIVSCGIHSSMPHHTGEGPLRAGQPIVIDIFPRSQKSGYFGDMTRTVVRGEPSKELQKMYQAVLMGQKLGISLIRDGVRTKDVHGAIVEFFNKSGFKTEVLDGKRQGFIHSTGHGLGLQIHEPPRIGYGNEVLETGNVVTVEPGLYYEKHGGIRIEDVVVVKKDGCENLTRYPKRFRV